MRNVNPELGDDRRGRQHCPIDDPTRAVVGTATPPVIAPGHTFGIGHRQDQLDRPDAARRRSAGGSASASAFAADAAAARVARLPARSKGIGIWGNNVPVGWAFAIINFVWWIGIGHAGTLISAILLLLQQTWRTSINRFAEAMTLFAVACAGIFPLFHIGRPWLAYWLLPYPEHDERLAAVPQPADLGRVRGLDLRHGVAAVLVRRPDPRSGDAARPLAVARRPRHLRHAGDGLARLGAPLAPLRDRLSAARRPGDAAGRLGAHRRQLRLRGRDRARAGTRRSSRPTSSPARSTPASRWC